ncbi:MAG: penicillin-binding transpeptidase domain-containing protein, partial [Pseudomonadota bacterium]
NSSDLDGALVLMDTGGAVRAMVGGKDYRQSRFNRAVSAKRQPGSAFKPFVYAAALEAGWQPGTVIDDVPFKIGDWQPRNPGGGYAGEVSLTEALARSINTVAVRLAELVGLKKVAATARRFGIGDDIRTVPSLALGTSEVTLIDLTSAFAPFAGEGLRRPYFAVETVHDQWGRPLYRHRPTEVPVTTPVVAGGMRTMLEAVVNVGTGKAAALPDRQAAGKTGTTQGARDAWFIGFSGAYVLGVWIGRDDNQPMPGVNGSNLPASLWRQVMQATPPHTPPAVVAGTSGEGEPLLHQPWLRQGVDWLGRKVNQAIDSVVN